MNIIHISTFDQKGGAARSAYNLHMGLRSINVNSKMIVRHSNRNEENVSQYAPKRSLINLCKFIKHKTINIYMGFPYSIDQIRTNYGPFSNIESIYGLDLINDIKEDNIINLHWISNFIDYRNFFGQISNRHTVVWTLHDMNPFTGGCHYSYNCEKYTNNCFECPQISKHSKKDLAKIIFDKKNKIFSNLKDKNVTIVTPSKWLAAKAESSYLFKNFSIKVINYGIDTDVFRQRNKKHSREYLGIPVDANVVLYIADNLKSVRKGYNEFFHAISNIDKDNDIFILFIGHGQLEFNIDKQYKHIDNIDGNYELSLAYSASDLFACTSLEDNLPNTILESIACGTPVVGFEVGGIPEIVIDDITGILSKPYDTKQLAQSIERLIDDENYRNSLSKKCIKYAQDNFTYEIQAKKYLDLYNQVLSAN